MGNKISRRKNRQQMRIAVFTYDGALKSFPIITHLCGVFDDIHLAKKWIEENRKPNDKYIMFSVDEM